MLTIVTWLWGRKYGADDVRKLSHGFGKHLAQPHRFICCSDVANYGSVLRILDKEDVFLVTDPGLCNVTGCMARLRMFDPDWQASCGIEPGERIVSCDLDAVVTGVLDPVFDRSDAFCILQGVHSGNPCPYNGSVFMLRAGYRPDVWADFSIEAAGKVPFYEFPDDQGWMHHKIPGATNWMRGPESGLYGFQKPGWPKGDDLPKDARLVAFPGWRSPEKFKHLAWVQEHWR